MIKKHKISITCDMCGTDNIYEYTTITNAISRKINICKKCAIKDGLIEQTEEDILSEIPLLTPQQIFEKLNEVVIGQVAPKKALAIELYNHVLRLKEKGTLNKMGMTIKKNNLLLSGPSGCGKTMLAETISKALNIPMVIYTASQLTEHGYSGNDIESILSALLAKCDGNVKLAEKGIVFIDEIDKLARRDIGDLSKDVNASGVQRSLLRMIESDQCSVPPIGSGRLHPDQKLIEIDTSDILFICGGAFSGIEKIVEDRLNKKDKGLSCNTIGFGSSNSKKKQYTTQELRTIISVEDLIEYGMLQEFVGRFPIISNLQPLDTNDLIKIMQLPGGILDEYKAYFQLIGKTLNIQNSALQHIAKIVLSNGTGARGIRSVLKNLLEDHMFNAPSDSLTTKYTITQKNVEKLYEIALEETA